ncbi:sugar phosphate isomerase/epimerase family protein [Georgenia alba]|uniref:Sugar phosphate isomerase/epimerase family protein n=1 Tax=Georgenia alba TaxID=2233858 RepID=A0ABW2Q8S4_9MICO
MTHDAHVADLALGCHLNVVVTGLDDPALPAALDALAAAGYSRVVLPPVDPDAIDVPALREAFAARGLVPVPIAGQTPEADVSSADAGVRAAGSAVLRRMVRLTADLGSDQLNGVPYGQFGPPGGPTSADALERSAREVGAVADEAAEAGVRMTFEVLNRYETSALNTAAQAVEYVAMSGSANLRIHLDTFHMAVEEADMRAAVRDAVPLLGYLELGQSGRGHLASGSVDVAAVVATAVAAGYRGPIGIEAFSRGVLGLPASDMLAIWREPYGDGLRLAADAADLIRDAVRA